MKYVSKFSIIAALAAMSGSVAVAEEPSKEQMELGKANYVTCLACHGVDGKGMAAGPLKMGPSFAESKLLKADDEIPIAIVLKGIAKEDAKYIGIMAPLGAALDDEKLAAVLTYVRNSFGNTGPAVSAEKVKEVREKYKDRTEQWKRAELDALAEKLKN